MAKRQSSPSPPDTPPAEMPQEKPAAPGDTGTQEARTRQGTAGPEKTAKSATSRATSQAGAAERTSGSKAGGTRSQAGAGSATSRAGTAKSGTAKTGSSRASGGGTGRSRTAKPAGGAGSDGAAGQGPTREQIQQRAYEIYQRRGGGHGRHEDDWAQAERELREEAQKARA